MAVEKTKDKTNLEINTENTEIIIDPKTEAKVDVDKSDDRIRIKDKELLKDNHKKINPLTKLIITVVSALVSVALGIILGIAIINIPTVNTVTEKYFSALSSGNSSQVKNLIDNSSTNLDMILPPEDSFDSLKGIFQKVNITSSKINGDTAEIDAKVDVKDVGENQFSITLKKQGTYLLFFPDWKVENLQGSGD
ncbi:MAG: hypothetical protein LBT99_04015 [Bifidobacteriaceae bacterium]|jgi:uncharacterized membrane protein YvbJ|nr:hypothetical protein [Bifidobacteriaceae bacterium]